MSRADVAYFSYMSLAVLLVAGAVILLVSSPLKKHVSVRLVFAAVLVTPLAQLLLFVAWDQIPAIGLNSFLRGEFLCGGIHGGGYRSDCSIFGVVFEGMINSFIVSFVSFGLLPLTIFLWLIVYFTALKKLFGKGAKPPDQPA